MKTIIFVRDMKTEDQADRIRAALEDTRVEYKVALESGAVVIEGSWYTPLRPRSGKRDSQFNRK